MARRRSLRWRAGLAVVGVVLLPLVLVWLSDLADRATARGLALAADQVAADAAGAWAGPDEAAARARTEQLAARAFARIRVLTPDGTLLHDVDREGFPWLDGLAAAVFFGPDPPSFAEADASLPPLPARPEVQAPGSGARCVRADPGPVLLCGAARRTTERAPARLGVGSPGASSPPARDAIVHVEIGSRRAIRALYEVRYPFLKLTAYMAVVGLALWAWLDRRLVAPVLALRDQLRRGRGAAVTVAHHRPDEIGELADAFNDLVGALDARNRANAAFMADAAHELKNPVAAVRVAAEALDGSRPLDAERAKRLGTVLLDASRRMDAVVTELLEIARAEAGLPGQERVPVDLGALARGLADVANASPGPRVVVEGEATPLRGVPHGVETVLRNLIDNGRAFARDRVLVRLAEGRDGPVLTVADDGPGIADDDLPRLFDRFFTRRVGGTGLGLALVKALVEGHGGTVAARSGPEGATFEVHWRRASAENPPA